MALRRSGARRTLQTPLGLPQGFNGFCATLHDGSSSAKAVNPPAQAQGRGVCAKCVVRPRRSCWWRTRKVKCAVAADKNVAKPQFRTKCRVKIAKCKIKRVSRACDALCEFGEARSHDRIGSGCGMKCPLSNTQYPIFKWPQASASSHRSEELGLEHLKIGCWIFC